MFEIRFKSSFNWHFRSEFLKSDWLLVTKKLIYMENILNLIQNGGKRLDFLLILTFSIEFDHFRLNTNWHLDGHFWNLKQKMIKTDQNSRSIIIEIRSKLRLLIWSRRWNSNWTKIDDRNRPARIPILDNLILEAKSH